MATTYTSDAVAQGLGRKTIYLDHRSVVKTLPVLVINDVIEMVPVFKNEQVVGVELQSDDLDSNGTPLIILEVGDGDDTNRYIDASTIARTGGLAKHTAGCPFSYTAADSIDIKVVAAPATGVAGDVTLSVLVK